MVDTMKFHGLETALRDGGTVHPKHVDTLHRGEVARAGTLREQIDAEIARIRLSLTQIGRDLTQLLELRVFVVQDAAHEHGVAEAVADALVQASANGTSTQKPSTQHSPAKPLKLPEPPRRPVLTVVRVHELALGGVVGIEAISVPGGDRVESSSGRRYGFPTTLRIGQFVASRATPNVAGDLVQTTHVGLAELGAGLAAVGASPRDIVKYNIFYRGDGTAEDWAFSARARAEMFIGPGPATTGIPVPRLADPAADIQFAMIGKIGGRTSNGAATVRPDRHWDWPIPLPHFHGNRVQELGFVGGQVSLAEDAQVCYPDDHRAQTRRSMEYIRSILRDLRRDLSDVVRLTAFYEAGQPDIPQLVREEILAALSESPAGDGAGQADEQADELSNEHRAPHGRVELSLVGLKELAYRHMVVEIECQFERQADA